MTKSKNLILITTLLCFSLFLIALCFVGCGKNQTSAPQLTTPQVVYEDGTIKWEPVKNAEKYEVKINGLAITTYNHFYDLPLTETSQDYNVSVKSIGKNNNDSKFCDPLIFNAKMITTTMEVFFWQSSPNCLKPNVGISFKEISGISNYIIKINDCNKGTYSTNSINFDSSEFKTGKNIISVEPDIKVEGYDKIVPCCVTVEKSEPLPNIDNYKLIDGQIHYGYNYEYIYDTSFAISGYTNSIALRNYEEGKIVSDGPIIEIYKCIQSTRHNLQIYSDKYCISNIKYENCDYTFAKIEVIAQNGEVLFSQIIDFSSQDTANDFYINKIDLKSESEPDHIKISTWKKDCLASCILDYSIQPIPR